MLLKNEGGTLPLKPAAVKSIAVVGPFAACWQGPRTDAVPRYLSGVTGQCYLHSYNGKPSNITSIFGGIKAAASIASPPLFQNTMSPKIRI